MSVRGRAWRIRRNRRYGKHQGDPGYGGPQRDFSTSAERLNQVRAVARQEAARLARLAEIRRRHEEEQAAAAERRREEEAAAKKDATAVAPELDDPMFVPPGLEKPSESAGVEAAPAPKRRGRPRQSDDSPTTAQLSDADGTAAVSAEPRRTGRPRGSRDKVPRKTPVRSSASEKGELPRRLRGAPRTNKAATD